VFDFEFFHNVAYHKKLTMPTALLLMDSLTKIALSSVFYQHVAINTLKTLIMRFSKSPGLLDHWKEQFRQILASLFTIETRIRAHNEVVKVLEQDFFAQLSL